MSNSITTRRVLLVALSVPAVILSVLALVTVQAAAFTGYSLPVYFGAAGSGAGQFNEPAGVAVNDVSHDVYVYDSGDRRVEWFSASGGKFEGEITGSTSPTGRFAPPAHISEHAAHGNLFNLAVDNDPLSPSTGDVYVVDPGHNVIDKFSATGAYLSQLSGFSAPIFGVTVDDEGHLWVEEEGSEAGGNHGVADEFSNGSTNTLERKLELPFLRSPGIGVDSTGDLYLLRGEPEIVKFDKSGAILTESVANCNCLTGFAIDRSDNDVFTDTANSIVRYGPFGEPYNSPLETLEGVSSSRGIAVDGADNVVYASQLERNSVAVLTFGLLPDVTTGNAGEVQRTSAKLEGEVNPDGQEVTSCEFEYGASEAYGHTVPCGAAPGSGSSPVTVTASVASLTAQSTYHYRLVAGNTTGRHAGADKELTTPPAVENVVTGSAVAVEGTTATIQGSFEPNGLETSYMFEYLTLAWGFEPPTELKNAGEAHEDAHVNAPLSGLKPNELYLFRIVAENPLGRTDGGFQTFHTKVLPPAIPGNPNATFVAAQSADLNAAVNPENITTHYRFEYGACPKIAGCATAQSTPAETSTAYGTIDTSAEVVGLAPLTTYSYRLVAINEAQETTAGTEGTFTTSPAPVPSVTTGAYTVLGPTSAIVTGTVEPHGVPTSYTIEAGIYKGASTRFGVVAAGSVGSGAASVPVSTMLTGLQPGSTYAYHVTIASGYILNETGTLTGGTGQFTTPGLAAALEAPQVLAQLPIPGIEFPKALKPSSKHKKKTTRKKHASSKNVKPKKARGSTRRHRG